MFSLGRGSDVSIRNEILSGLTVALALVPEAVAFAFVAGVDPLVGLYAAFMVGLLASIFGGRPGMISGATGAMAVVMVSLVSEHGVEYLFATVGVNRFAANTRRCAEIGQILFVFVPYPVMLGFVNGLAIVIFLAQIQHFQVDVNGTKEMDDWSAPNDFRWPDSSYHGDYSLFAQVNHRGAVFPGGYCGCITAGHWFGY